MNTLPFVTLLFYAIIIVCKASAKCPCHIPCTGKPEVCTCYGECGDDGYGCKRNGEDYEFLDQIKCGENKWQIQCFRQNAFPISLTLDDTNPYAAYKQTTNNLIESFDDDEDQYMTSSAASFSWFGGNWFDFWGQNAEQFFGSDDIDNDNDQNIANIKNKYNQYDDITIDDHDYTPQSSSRTLQKTKSSQKQILDDLGRNEAGYKIIQLPLYILIICIVCASLLGMLMCAGFVYCGLNCCCPLPPSSPILSSQQRSNAVEMSRVLQSLSLGSGNKSDTDYGVYHRMRNALHNPTNDEASSILSNEIDDEYVDSEDDLKEETVTRGEYYEETKGAGYGIVVMEEREPFALNGKCESDIDNDSDDSMMERLSQLIVTQMVEEDSYNDIDIEEEKDIIGSLMNENEYDDDDDPDIIEGIDGMVTVQNDDDEENNDEEENNEEMDYTENEGTPLINENGNNSVARSSNLP